MQRWNENIMTTWGIFWTLNTSLLKCGQVKVNLNLLLFLTTHVDLCHKELESHAELKLTNMASPPAQLYKQQIPCTIHHNKALKGEKQEYHFQNVVGVSFRCRSGKCRFLQTVLTKFIIEGSSRDTFLSCSNKKNLFVDYFHFLLGQLPWQRSETGVPNASVCVWRVIWIMD